MCRPAIRPAPLPIAAHQAMAAVSTDVEVGRVAVQCLAPPRGGTHYVVKVSTLVDDAVASSMGNFIPLILKNFFASPSLPLYCQQPGASQRESAPRTAFESARYREIYRRD